MIFLKRSWLFLLIMALSYECFINAFSLKSLSSWAFNYKEESLYQEYQLHNKACVSIKQTIGSISIKTWQEPKIVIEALKSAKEKELSKCFIEIATTEQTIVVQTKCTESASCTVDYAIIMPRDAHLVIEAGQSDIVVKGVEGSINIVIEEGSIDIRQANNGIYAKNNRGSIFVSAKYVPDSNMISLESHGPITLSIPLSINALLQAKAPNGLVESEHPVTIRSFKAKLSAQMWDNCKHEVFGTLGIGGPKIKLHAHTGNIKLIDY